MRLVFSHSFSKTLADRICDPIWKCNPLHTSDPDCKRWGISASASSGKRPNLFSANPVVIWLCVCASTSGLSRSNIGAMSFFDPANRSMFSNSGTLSTTKAPIRASKESKISSSLLPTPAKKISEAGKPASIAASISPPLTQSAPKPAAATVCKIRG